MANPIPIGRVEETFTGFNFAIEIDIPEIAPRLCRAAFAECEGLGLTMQARAIHEGGNPGREIQLPGARSYGQLTLRRGMTPSFDLWDWVDAFLRPDSPSLRPDAEVVLLASDGTTERARFLLRRCLPVLLKAPTLNAQHSAVVIEELQLVYESVILKRPGVVPGIALSTRPLVKAQLRQLDSGFGGEISRERNVVVQFNPETLRVSHANQIVAPQGGGGQADRRAEQFVGAGVSRLEARLWFDVTSSAGASDDDVRRLTQRVAYFITPTRTDEDPPRYVPRAVRFLWGSFQFDGVMESLEETLELFSADGKPLRASVDIVISRQEIREYAFGETDRPPRISKATSER
jgi:phage tail-like protein